MSSDYETVFEDRRGAIPVRLEAAPKVDAAGRAYAHYRLVASEGRSGAVIVATRGEDLLLVRSHRESAGRDMWELPRGAGDADDADFATTGRRELREETGYAAEAEPLGQYLTDSTLFPHPMGVVHCAVTSAEPDAETDGEILESRWFGRAEVMGMIGDGTICDGHSLAALAVWIAKDLSG